MENKKEEIKPDTPVKIRVRFSDMEHYIPIKFRVLDTENARTIKYGPAEYAVFDAELDYGKKQVELCLPYHKFLKKILRLPYNQQLLIRDGKAVITLMKTFRSDEFGMKIVNVEEYMSPVDSNTIKKDI